MRYLIALTTSVLFSISFATMAADANAAKPAQTPNKASCLAKCDTEKENCFGMYKKSDSMSGTYITPDGQKACFQAYHACKANCPKK